MGKEVACRTTQVFSIKDVMFFRQILNCCGSRLDGNSTEVAESRIQAGEMLGVPAKVILERIPLKQTYLLISFKTLPRKKAPHYDCEAVEKI
jgi:hypothetical protein